jgi:hypothetical protein
MNIDTGLKGIREYRLEDWVNIFARMYASADADRDASSLWLDVLDESSNVAEYVRREEYRKAIDTVPDVFARLLSFVAKYSANATDATVENEGIDLRPEDDGAPYLTAWVLKKYPAVCSVCARKPCICPSSRYERETRNEDVRIPEIIPTSLRKYKIWEDEVVPKIDSFTVEALFSMFNEIYSGVQRDPPISSICFHFLEEVGEVAKLLLSFNNIQILRMKNNGSYRENLDYLNIHLKSEISDVISWIMALINKANFIFRSTYPHYHCVLSQEKVPGPEFRHMTLSELMLNRFYDHQGRRFLCPHCESEKCSPQCRENRLIAETENRMKREHDLMHEVRKALGRERRSCPRKKTKIPANLNGHEINIVDMGKDNLGFLCNEVLSLNDEWETVIVQGDTGEWLRFRITRAAIADVKKTGFDYFCGAVVVNRAAQSTASAAKPN